MADSFGLFGRIVNCFGTNFKVLDIDGEEVERGSIELDLKTGSMLFLEGGSKFQEGDDIVLYLEGSENTLFQQVKIVKKEGKDKAFVTEKLKANYDRVKGVKKSAEFSHKNLDDVIQSTDSKDFDENSYYYEFSKAEYHPA